MKKLTTFALCALLSFALFTITFADEPPPPCADGHTMVGGKCVPIPRVAVENEDETDVLNTIRLWISQLFN